MMERFDSTQHPPHSSHLTLFDFFAGIGGFSLAAERWGIKPVGFCEINPHCQQTLKCHWPNTLIYSDINHVTRNILPTGIDIFAGGSPCQGFSQNGNRQGLDDSRSQLWLEYLRVLHDYQPPFFIWENVEGAINSGLRAVLGGLRMAGYHWDHPQIISAKELGLPHQRCRILLVAYSNGTFQSFQSVPTPWAEQIRAQIKKVRELRDNRIYQPGFRGVDDGLPVRVGIPKRTVGAYAQRQAYGNAIAPRVAEITFLRVLYLHSLREREIAVNTTH